MFIIWFIYQFWIFIQGTSLALSFTRDLRNLTIIYKPNAFIYHICQTSHSINSKRIRWHYESLNNSNNNIDTYCKQLFQNFDCFDFYYGPSISVLVIKEPDIFIGKYTCQININSTYEIKSIGWIDIKLPSNNIDEYDQSMKFYNENELGNLAIHYNVPFIFDANDLTSFGKRIQLGGVFYTECKSIESLYPINFLWIHLQNTSERMKTIRFIQHDGNHIIIKENKYLSSLLISSVNHSDDGDYVCIASNEFGRSFSSKRSLIVTERMVLPRIHTNLQNNSYIDLRHNDMKELVCIANGYPIPDVTWIRVFDWILLARNQSHAILKFDDIMHGVNKYMCEAKNKHGLTKIFIDIIKSDTQIKLLLYYSNIKSRSIILSWYVSNERYDRFNYFIIYYRRLHNLYKIINDQDEMINNQDYQKVLIDPRTTNYNFTFQMIDLIPFTKYEFRLQGLIGDVPTDYSNPVFIITLDIVPQKIENLHGYVWNETSVVVHWTPPNSTNGPNFYYILYYTTNTSIPFSQWSDVIIRTYPFHIISLPISSNFQLFIRVASVNTKGLILSDFHIINNSLSNNRFISTINKFQCFSNNENQLLTLQWSIDHKSHLYIEKYLLYYSDLAQNNDDFIQLLIIPIDLLSIDRQSTYNLLKYEFNMSLLNLNYNQYHILRLHLSIIDANQNQLLITLSPIYCILTRKLGKNNTIFSLSEIVID
ncbi:unnamed protein product [Rotaria sp. Silwood1]|nr:unnamed protein product [Rotaria sp. Silwood1]